MSSQEKKTPPKAETSPIEDLPRAAEELTPEDAEGARGGIIIVGGKSTRPSDKLTRKENFEQKVRYGL